jgi:chromosome segregation ATPase
MFQNIEELKNEIETFRDNMNRSNGSIALISEAIEQLNSNLYTLKQLSEKFELTKNELESKIDNLESNQKISEEATFQKLNDMNTEIKEHISLLNRQVEEFKSSIEENTNNQTKTYLSALDDFKSNCEQKFFSIQEAMNGQFKTIKILGGAIIGLISVLIVLNLI